METKILLVDDEEGICQVLSISLADLGYKVYTADCAAEALRIFREIDPPIVLTDIKMPGMDGLELLREIKRLDPETEVIMISGHGDMNLAIKSLKYEATDFVTKPIKDEALEIALKRAHEKIGLRKKIKQHTDNLEQLVDKKTRRLLDGERRIAVGQTMAGLSHVLRNIAGGLEGSVFILEKGMELDNKQYILQGWETVKVNVEKIRNLSLDLLKYAKPDYGNYRLCDPNKPVKDVIDLLKPRAEHNGIVLKTDLSSELRPHRLEPEGIHRCLLNLITNALDASLTASSEASSKEVIISTGKVDDGGVEYRIEDHGVGMDEEIKEKVFNSFFSTKGAMGTGLGLMITKRVIDEHRGIIKFESEKGIGTTFTIILPRIFPY
ncbi:MAG: response regulator [Deltaproteobacteria bacterium]|nr:response regulator [Deltaproteobacteria bacterium]MBW2053114.1 response regulator [Deltaproteobacteria bacterium]MBW2141447.1 response regulator [Deltaproteobacteria bacterium]MBW2322582.1 response regulator [Deltaproteobacteria bacterium]